MQFFDFSKKVKYKERKKKRRETPSDYAYRENRTYKDFLEYMEKHLESDVVELDTVHGRNKTFDESGIQRSRVFYCDPLASWQKGKPEKNHEYIRRVIPKGKSLADYTQGDMTLLANHINSTERASLNGRTPYELARLLLKTEIFDVTEARSIAADEILLKPALLTR